VSDGAKQCPYCGETILSVAIKCRFCGSMISETANKTSDSDTHIRNVLASRFEIQEIIGRGGMSIVYKALQRNLNRTLALKVLPIQFTYDQEFLGRFHREAQAAAQLNHPNIIKTYFDEGMESDVHYIAMEFIDGEDLHARVKRLGPFPLKHVFYWAKAIANALEYAHAREIVHRDVKSSNIMIDRNGRPVLMDFGIAHAFDTEGLTRTGTVIGTPEYMSPEQARGMRVDSRSDIYSLGVVMYEWLTGRLPFQQEMILGTIHAILHDPPPPPRRIRPNIPEELELLVLKCLAKEPADRYSSCGDVIRSLEAGLRKMESVHPRGVKAVNHAQSASNLEEQTDRSEWVLYAIVIIMFLILGLTVLAKL
jgi:serine/threonine protein kinase